MKKIDVPLPHGIDIGGKRYRDIEMREASAGDLFDAEDMVPGAGEIQFSAALAMLQITRVGNPEQPFEGDLTLSMVRGMKSVDLAAIRQGQARLDAMSMDDDEDDEGDQPKNDESGTAT